MEKSKIHNPPLKTTPQEDQTTSQYHQQLNFTLFIDEMNNFTVKEF